MAVCAPPISGRRSRRCSCRNDPRMAGGDVFWRRRFVRRPGSIYRSAKSPVDRSAGPVSAARTGRRNFENTRPGGGKLALWAWHDSAGTALERPQTCPRPSSAWLPRPRLRDISFCSCEHHSPAAGLMTYGRIRPARNPRPAAFFPAACGGSSRPLRFKKAARSGPPLPLRPSGFSRPRRPHHGPPSQGNGPRREQKETFK